MSQVYVGNGSGGGGGSGITTINGDSGSITGTTVTIYADNAAQVSGSSVKFVNSGTISTFEVTDSSRNTLIGQLAGNATLSGSDNVGLGYFALGSLTSGTQNTAVGYEAAIAITSGQFNTAFGLSALGGVKTGNANLVLGYSSAANYTTSESNNIIIGNLGVTGESNVMRIGVQGSGSQEQNKCFIAGIEGVTVSTPAPVTINPSTGQLGQGTYVYFQAYRTTNQTVAGGSTSATVVFDTAIANVGSAYNTSTGVFTAPATGFYAFSSCLFFSNLNSLAANTQAILAYTGSVQSLRLIEQGIGSYSGGASIILTVSWSMPMTSGDTVQVQPFADGTGNYTIAGGAESSSAFNTSSTFSGYRVA